MSRIWYAAYGSNLSRARFDIYLKGGRPIGAAHTYPGCRDASTPVSDVACEIEAELAFGGTSKTWGGGVALLTSGPTSGPPSGDAVAKARLYLLTVEQVADVVAQENWLHPGTVTLEEAAFHEPVVLDGDHMYGTVLPLGSRDGLPVVAVTQTDDAPPAIPSDAYLFHIADGLRDAHGMSDGEVASYLASKRGIAGALSAARIVEVIAVPG